MGMRIIVIWGGLIALYLLVANAQGTTGLLSGLQKFVTGTTGVLQGRGNLNTQG